MAISAPVHYMQWLIRNSRLVVGVLVAANVSLSVLWAYAQPGQDADLPQIQPTLKLIRPAQPVAAADAGSAHLNAAVDGVAPTGTAPGPIAPLAKSGEPTAGDIDPAHAAICQAFGPFTDENEARAFRDLAIGRPGGAQIHRSEISGRSDYMVYIEPLGSPQRARRVLRALQSRDIDTHLISNNALSVGVFSERPRALAQQSRITGLGYEVGIEELSRRHSVFHVLVQNPPATPLPREPAGLCSDIAPS